MLLRNNHSSSFFIVDKIIFQKPLAICIVLLSGALISESSLSKIDMPIGRPHIRRML